MKKVTVKEVGKGIYVTNIEAITIKSGKKRKSIFSLFMKTPKLISPQMLFNKYM